MKKFLFMMVCAIALCAGFASCSSDDDPDPVVEQKKESGISNFKSIFYKNGTVDKTKVMKVKGEYLASTVDYNGPINVYKKIVGSYGSESAKDNRSESNNTIKGNYEFANNTIGVKLVGTYQPNKEGLYATLTINMKGIDIDKIYFYESSEMSEDLTPFQ